MMQLGLTEACMWANQAVHFVKMLVLVQNAHETNNAYDLNVAFTVGVIAWLNEQLKEAAPRNMECYVNCAQL